jgi:hypothetical protein
MIQFHVSRGGFAAFGTNIIPSTYLLQIGICTIVRAFFGLVSKVSLLRVQKSVIAFDLSGPPNLTIP